MIFTRREDQFWATRIEWEDAEKIIKEKWDEGYAITDLVYGDGMYYVLLEKGTGILAQEYLWSDSLEDLLKGKSKNTENMCITTFLWAEFSFCLVRSKFSSSPEQLWCKSASFPKEIIGQQWKKGYAITEVFWNDNLWYILFSKGIAYAQQESWETIFKPRPQKLNAFLRDEAKIVSSLCFGDGKWAFSYARHPEVLSQKTCITKEFPDEEITDLWNQGYDISKAAYGRGHWFLTFTSSEPDESAKVEELPAEVSESDWKRQMARKEQERRKSDMEMKSKKL